MYVILLFIVILNVSSQQNFCSQRCQIFTNSIVCNSHQPLCSWNQDKNLCVDGYIKPQINIYSTQNTQFCQENQNKCSLTYGCSFYNNACIRFLGCDAYQSYSDSDCVKISYLCTWDNAKKQCVRSPYYDYNGDVMQYRVCSEASQVWRNELGCPKYSIQCIYNGIQCTDTLANCSQYQTTGEVCKKLIGVDGKCDFINNCKAKTCDQYNSTECTYYRSDCYLNENGYCNQKKKCEIKDVTKKSTCLNTIEQNCYFDGKSCSLIPLQMCSVYSQESCQGIVGRDGICKLYNNQCVKLNCQDDYQEQYITKQIFEDYCQYLNVCEQIYTNCSKKNEDLCNNIIKTQNCYCQQCIVNKQECIYVTSQLECVQNQQLNSYLPCYWNQDLNSCQSATSCSQLYDQSSCKRFKSSCIFRNNRCLDALQLECTQLYDIEVGEGVLQKYCLEEKGCSILNGKCVTLFNTCESYLIQEACFKDFRNKPCVWNQQKRKCFTYKEREQLGKDDCENISSLWIFSNETCLIRKHCALLNDNEIGLEGNCTQFQLSQLQLGLNNCSSLQSNQRDCNYFNKICYFDQIANLCKNLECSQLNSTSCQPIEGFKIQDYKYCRLFGEQCIETLPTNEKECLIFSGGTKFFQDNYCISCIQDNECTYVASSQRHLDIDTKDFQNKLSILMIIFYILIQ